MLQIVPTVAALQRECQRDFEFQELVESLMPAVLRVSD